MRKIDTNTAYLIATWKGAEPPRIYTARLSDPYRRPIHRMRITIATNYRHEKTNFIYSNATPHYADDRCLFTNKHGTISSRNPIRLA